MQHTSEIIIIATFIGMLSGFWNIARNLRIDLQKNVDLLFKRFDDHKKDTDDKILKMQYFNDEKYVRMDLCNKTSGNIEERLKSIDIKLDALLAEKRNRVSG